MDFITKRKIDRYLDWMDTGGMSQYWSGRCWVVGESYIIRIKRFHRNRLHQLHYASNN